MVDLFTSDVVNVTTLVFYISYTHLPLALLLYCLRYIVPGKQVALNTSRLCPR